MIQKQQIKVLFFSFVLICICAGCLPFTMEYRGWFFFYEEDGRRIENVSTDIENKIKEEFRAIASEFGFKEIVNDYWPPDISFRRHREFLPTQHKNLDGSDNYVTLDVGFDGGLGIGVRDLDNNYETEFVSRLKTEIMQGLTKIGFKKEYIRFVRSKYTSMNN
jgi:hypothetical protein